MHFLIIHTLLFMQKIISLALLFILPLSAGAQSASTTADDVVQTEIFSYPSEMLQDDRVFSDFVVGPGKVELELAPGESKQVELMVTNRMGEPKRFKVEIEDAAGSRDPNQSVILLGDDRGPYTLKDYITLPAHEFELQHAERARLMVTVSLPADVEPGGRYGSVVISTVTRNATEERAGGASSRSALVTRIGTLFFITTPGLTSAEGVLTSFDTVGSKRLFNSGPITFGVSYENTGANHVNPYGEIRISNILGDEVGYIQLDPWFSLPQSLRTREATWNKEWLFGKYTAVAQVNRGYDNIIDTKTVTFWVVDWLLLAIIFACLFMFILIIRFFVTRFEFKRKV